MELHKAKLLKKQKNNDLDLTTLTQLPYLNAVVKEVLRVAPPVGAGYRKALQTFEIDVSRFHTTKCGATWFCHIPFCPEVKGMPSFEWLKIKEGETKGNPQNFQEFPNHFWLIS